MIYEKLSYLRGFWNFLEGPKLHLNFQTHKGCDVTNLYIIYKTAKHKLQHIQLWAILKKLFVPSTSSSSSSSRPVCEGGRSLLYGGAKLANLLALISFTFALFS